MNEAVTQDLPEESTLTDVTTSKNEELLAETVRDANGLPEHEVKVDTTLAPEVVETTQVQVLEDATQTIEVKG